ncbi:MAG: YncE family protein [Lentimicrobiaceae bacterium]|nr:YncE family protein [Lentimicrobiaceae bacterium]
MKLRFLLWSLPLVWLAISCTDEPEDNQPLPQDTLLRSSGVYVINEGSFNGNNASLTRFTFNDSTAVPDIFARQNGRGLGDTGSDLAIYGSKLYVVVNVSSQVEVVDATTCMSIKQIPLFDGTQARQPRKIAFYGSKAFVCNFDGTVAVIDTTTLAVEKYIQVGLNPDGILATGGKIWVSNSGGLSFPNYNNTLSVIDPVALTEEKQLTVGLNPFKMAADNYGDIYLVARGNYGDIKSRLQIIDGATGAVKHTFEDFEAINFSIAGDTAYVYNYDWATAESSILMLNVKTETVIRNSFITDGTVLQTVYGVAADPVSGLVYVSDAQGFTGAGKVYVFDQSGKRKFSFDAGINPAGFAFLNEKYIAGGKLK